MRVLLIEDEPTTAKSIELMLSAEGFNVYTTDLGEEGLDLGKLYDYDIICLDLNLPDMQDRKSTRLNSSHANISYAVFCLKKKKHCSPQTQLWCYAPPQ